jgi:thioesterase domain-containing protein/acyl carrier protein
MNQSGINVVLKKRLRLISSAISRYAAQRVEANGTRPHSNLNAFGNISRFCKSTILHAQDGVRGRKGSAPMKSRRFLEAVRAAWSAEFGRMPINSQTWRESGGDSIKIVSFLLELEKSIDKMVPLELLSLEMTPQSLAADLAARFESRLTFTDQNLWNAPLVFLFPWLGLEYRPIPWLLHRELRGKIRFVMINYPSWREMMRDGVVFETLVDAGYEQIRASKVDGPYLLIGESSGGFVAWEVARRLLESGSRVELLGLIDTLDPNVKSYQFPRLQIREVLSLVWSLSPKHTFRNIVVEPILDRSPLPLISTFGRAVRLALPSKVSHFSNRFSSRLRYSALRKLVVRPLRVPAVFFQSDDPLFKDSFDGWAQLCPALALIQIGGNHPIIDENLRHAIVEKLLQLLANRVGKYNT